MHWVQAYYWYSLAAKKDHPQAIAEAHSAGKHLSDAQRLEVGRWVANWQPKPPQPPSLSEEQLSRLSMIPAGYMYKKITATPEWLTAENVQDIYSVSRCISDDFMDYIDFWKHNGYWLFDSPEIMEELAREQSVDLSQMKLFYYEVFEAQYDESEKKWHWFEADESFVTTVRAPATKRLEGFDVTTFVAQTSPEHSPLSCNSMAKEIPVNEHCLLANFDEARKLLETDRFKNCERGPYRIIAVYSVDRSK